MNRIAIVVGSTRPARRVRMVADWVLEAAGRHPRARAGELELTLVDIADFDLPLLDESVPALMGVYEHEHTRRWADTVAAYDGFVFVTPEYNHSAPAALKNAIDFLFAEWNDKAAAYVSYGVHGGTRAAEHLRQVLGEVKVASVRTQVALSAFTEFVYGDEEDPGSVVAVIPGPHQEPTLHELLDELVAWSSAFAPLRAAPDLPHAAS